MEVASQGVNPSLPFDEGLVKLEAIPSTNYAMKGVVNRLDVLLKIQTGHLPETQGKRDLRLPLNLAIVLDRSGSMQAKQKLANAKLAIIKVIESLHDEDVLHLVCYGSTVETVFENADLQHPESRQILIHQVERIQTEGCTNLWGGLERGAELLAQHKRAGYSSRLFLFSDGLVNEGVVQDKRLIQQKVANEIYDDSNTNTQVSAFGLGDDFDEELMKGIAEHGNGAYFFIEGAAAIPNFVNFALDFVMNVVAREAVLKVRGGLSGVGLVTKVYGQEDSSSSALVKGIRLGDLRADNVRTMVVELEVRGDVREDEQQVLFCELSFRKAEKEGEAHEGKGDEEKEEEETVKVTTSLTLKFTNDSALVEQNQSAEVQVKAVIQQTAEIDKELDELMGGGYNSSEKNTKAIALYEKEIELLESVRRLDEEELQGANKVAALLKMAQDELVKLKEKGVTKERKKEAHHRNYMKRRG
ncbi:von Willebrand factor type A [Balamuthia mandrillaris]